MTEFNCQACGHTDEEHERVIEDTYGNERLVYGACNVPDCECEHYDWEES